MEAFTPARLETELRPLLRQPGHIAFAALVGEAARLLPTLLNLSTEEAEYVYPGDPAALLRGEPCA